MLTTESQAITDLAAVLKTTCYPHPIRCVGNTDVHSDLYCALTSRQSTLQLGLQTRYNPMILIVLYTSLHLSAPDNTLTLITALPVHSSVLDVQPIDPHRISYVSSLISSAQRTHEPYYLKSVHSTVLDDSSDPQCVPHFSPVFNTYTQLNDITQQYWMIPVILSVPCTSLQSQALYNTVTLITALLFTDSSVLNYSNGPHDTQCPHSSVLIHNTVTLITACTPNHASILDKSNGPHRTPSPHSPLLIHNTVTHYCMHSRSLISTE